jgi:hypothetical protein
MLGNKLPWSSRGSTGEFDPSDYERTPPASPMELPPGGNGRDVVEASLHLPKLVKNMGLGRKSDNRRPSLSSLDTVSVRNLKPVSPSPSNSRGGSRDYGSGGSKYGRRGSRGFAYDNGGYNGPKSDHSIGAGSNKSQHSGSGNGGSRVYGGSDSGAR